MTGFVCFTINVFLLALTVGFLVTRPTAWIAGSAVVCLFMAVWILVMEAKQR